MQDLIEPESTRRLYYHATMLQSDIIARQLTPEGNWYEEDVGHPLYGKGGGVWLVTSLDEALRAAFSFMTSAVLLLS